MSNFSSRHVAGSHSLQSNLHLMTNCKLETKEKETNPMLKRNQKLGNHSIAQPPTISVNSILVRWEETMEVWEFAGTAKMRVTFKISNMKSSSWGTAIHSCQQFFINYLTHKCCLYSIKITRFLKHNNMLEHATWKFIRKEPSLLTFWRISTVTMLLLEWLM